MKLPFAAYRRSIWEWIKYYVVGLYNRINDEDVLFLASGIAFNAILCLIPVLLLLTAALGVVLRVDHESIHSKIDEALDTVFPPQPYAQEIKGSIREVIHDIMHYPTTFGLTGLGSFIWTAASLFSSIRIVLNRIYKINTLKLVYIRVVENIVLVIVLTVLFFVANAFTWIFHLVDSLISQIPQLDRFSITSFVGSIPFAWSYLPALVMFYIVNRFIPDRSVTSKIAFVSAITSATLWWIAGEAFSWYLTAFHSYSALYGAYAFLLVFLVWIYYSAVVFIVGVVVGQLYRERT